MATPPTPPPVPAQPPPSLASSSKQAVGAHLPHEEVPRPTYGRLFKPTSVVMPMAAFGMVFILGSYIYYSLSASQWNARHVKDKMRDEAKHGELSGGGRAERRRERGVDA